VVKDFDDESVTIDYNHPLAGKDLVFDVTIIREQRCNRGGDSDRSSWWRMYRW